MFIVSLCCAMRDAPNRCDAPNLEMRPMRWVSARFLKPKGEQNVVSKARRWGGTVSPFFCGAGRAHGPHRRGNEGGGGEMTGLDLTVFDERQQLIIVSLLEDMARLQWRVLELERQMKWLKQHMPEPDLSYMG